MKSSRSPAELLFLEPRVGSRRKGELSGGGDERRPSLDVRLFHVYGDFSGVSPPPFPNVNGGGVFDNLFRKAGREEVGEAKSGSDSYLRRSMVVVFKLNDVMTYSPQNSRCRWS